MLPFIRHIFADEQMKAGCILPYLVECGACMRSLCQMRVGTESLGKGRAGSRQRKCVGALQRTLLHSYLLSFDDILRENDIVQRNNGWILRVHDASMMKLRPVPLCLTRAGDEYDT